MTPITPQLLDHLAALARLAPDEAERREMTGDLEKILDYLAALDGLDTGDAPDPDGGRAALGLDALRPDDPASSLPRPAVLACAGAEDGTYLLAPRAVE
jgi:aspartyl/glutamyl-tRNA(Asn/Gln) amidotransferase C subunit